MTRDLYDIAREVTDEVLGEGAYAESNKGNRDPVVQEQVAKSRVRICDLCAQATSNPQAPEPDITACPECVAGHYSTPYFVVKVTGGYEYHPDLYGPFESKEKAEVWAEACQAKTPMDNYGRAEYTYIVMPATAVMT